MQNYVVQPQPIQVPNYSGVNIQIFNPTVGAPGCGAPVYNVNSPNYQSNPNNHYPAGYYINQWGSPQQPPSASASATATATVQPMPAPPSSPQAQTPDAAVKDEQKTSTPAAEDKKPDSAAADKDAPKETTKKEKRKIVQLTDDYIKTLENYLNSQDKEVRLMGAKEVVARLMEDESRKDDKALNALVNKMLQDPSEQVKFLALSMLDSRNATGDMTTVQLLQAMQQSKSGYGQDALLASNILLKMAGKTVEKEFEVKDDKKAETKNEAKTTSASKKE